MPLNARRDLRKLTRRRPTTGCDEVGAARVMKLRPNPRLLAVWSRSERLALL